MSKLAKLWQHIMKGSLGTRIRYQFSRQKKWETFLKSSRQFTYYSPVKGIKLKLYKDSYLSYLIFRGNYEQEELFFITRFLKPGDVFADIGANIGIFSLLAARTTGDKGKVYCFEPVKATFGRLKENIQLNHFSNITPFNIAISDSAGVQQMSISADGFDAWNTLGTLTRGEKFTKEDIRTETIDNLVAQGQLPSNIKLIKIDVEGWELAVLKGGMQLLSRPDSPVLLIEFNDNNFKGAGYKGNDIIKFLNGLGYSFYELSMNKSSLVPAAPRNHFEYCNLVASKSPVTLH